MKIATKILNYAGYLIGCNVLGTWFAKLYWSLFKFLTDEDYASEHPRMYLLKFGAALAFGTILALVIVWYPLTKAFEWINRKIDSHFDKEKEDEEDDFEDDYDFLK